MFIATAAIGGKLTRISYLTHVGNFNSATITVPGTARTGDFLLLVDISSNSSGGAVPTNVVPSGWTQISTVGAGAVRGTSSWKLATSSDPGATVTGMDALFDAKLLVVFRPNIPATSASTADPAIELTGGDPTAQTITSGSGTVPLVSIGVYWASAEEPQGRSFSPAADGEINNGSILYLRYKSYNFGTTPSDITVDMSDSQFSSLLHSFYFQMSR